MSDSSCLTGERFCFHGPAEGLGHGLVEISDELEHISSFPFLESERVAEHEILIVVEVQSYRQAIH
jgi:hypothetical protein